MRKFISKSLRCVVFGIAVIALRPGAGNALLIVPTFDTASVVDASDAAAYEAAVTAAINKIDGLYSNIGTLGVYFSQTAGTDGESEAGDVIMPYSCPGSAGCVANGNVGYVQYLAATSAANPANTVLSTAVANLQFGNDSNGANAIAMTTGMARVALGVPGVTGCFDSSGNVISACGGSSSGAGVIDGLINIASYLNYSNGNAVDVIEHELDEVLGGGGQGSTLNSVYACQQNSNNCDGFQNFMGPLDLYRYAATGTNCSTIENQTPSFTTNPSATACLSVNGGTSAIVQFNQYPGGDSGDFAVPGADVQSYESCCGSVPAYNTTTPEYSMMLAIGYEPMTTSTPEPASLILLGTGLAATFLARRRRRTS